MVREKSQWEKDGDKARSHAKANGYWGVREVIGYETDTEGYRSFVYVKAVEYGYDEPRPEERPEDTIRVAVGRVKPEGYADCECCGLPIIGEWKCDGCRKSPCVKSSTWHCTGKFGHSCDGTVCPTTKAEAEADAEEQRQRVLHPRTRKPGFVPFRQGGLPLPNAGSSWVRSLPGCYGGPGGRPCPSTGTTETNDMKGHERTRHEPSLKGRRCRAYRTRQLHRRGPAHRTDRAGRVVGPHRAGRTDRPSRDPSSPWTRGTRGTRRTRRTRRTRDPWNPWTHRTGRTREPTTRSNRSTRWNPPTRSNQSNGDPVDPPNRSNRSNRSNPWSRPVPCGPQKTA